MCTKILNMALRLQWKSKFMWNLDTSKKELLTEYKLKVNYVGAKKLELTVGTLLDDNAYVWEAFIAEKPAHMKYRIANHVRKNGEIVSYGKLL